MAQQGPGSTQLSLASSGLLSLVDELLLNILDHIDSREALCHLAATCMRFQDLVEPYIWRELLVLNGMHARKIALALDTRDARVDFVQSISIRYKEEFKEGIEELNHFIALMGRLKHLTVESPCPNNSEWRAGVFFDGYSRIDYTNLLASAVYPRLGLPLALPMLQSLTLHGHGPADRKFHLDRAKAMFLHPTLRNISLSCLNFEADMGLNDDMIVENHKSTLLQSLTLIECNVNVRFLDVVLSLPKALKELSISERLHLFPDCVPSLDKDVRTSSALFLTALQRQADSLKKLTHIGGRVDYIPSRVTDPDGAAKLRSLEKLEFLELGFESHLYYYLRKNGFPPSLQTFKLNDAAISLNAGHDIRSMANVAFHSITSLLQDCVLPAFKSDFMIHLKFCDHPHFRLFVIAHPAEQDRMLSTIFLDRPAIYKIASVLRSYNARFRISRETFPSGTAYIPPFMYGEELPVEEGMYDSNDYWRFNGIDYQVMDDQELRAELKGKNLLKTCMRCITRHIECTSVGDGSPCVQCLRPNLPCTWPTENQETDAAGETQSAVA